MSDNHTQIKEALEDAANRALAAVGAPWRVAYTSKGSWVTNDDGSVTPPVYAVTVTQVSEPTQPPDDPTPPPSDPVAPPDTDGFKYVRGLDVILPVYPATLPPAGSTWSDPTTGSTILRFADYTSLPDDGGGLRNVYSRSPCESPDGKYVLQYGVGSPTCYVYDRMSRALVREMYDVDGKPFGEGDDIRWSYVEPTVLIYHRGMKLYKHDVVTNAITLLRDFSADFPGADLISMEEEGNSSYDSRYWAFEAMVIPKSGSYYPIAFFTYDAVDDKILGTMTFETCGLEQGATTPEGRMPSPNMVEVSPDGRWALVHWDACWGTGSDPNTSANGNLAGTHADGPHCYPLDLDVTKAVKVATDSTHSAWALSAEGKWLFVAQNNGHGEADDTPSADWIEASDPDIGWNPQGTGVVRLINQKSLGWNTGYHFAGSPGAPGWVLMSTYASDNSQPGDNQLMLLPITNNCDPLRLSPTYGLHNGEVQNKYFQEAAACWSVDGRRVWWPGNFGGKVPVDPYCSELPADWQTVAGVA